VSCAAAGTSRSPRRTSPRPLVAAGTTVMLESGTITQALADALGAEARDRADAGRFFGHIAYASLTATRPLRD